MSEWKEYKLSELMELIGGGTPKTSIPEYWGGDIPWLSVTDFNNGKKFCFDAEKKITERGLSESNTKLLKKGQIIISARGTVGVVSVLGRDMAFNQSSYGIDAAKSITCNDFLYYLLKANIANFHSASYGAVFDTITKETFNQIVVILPPLPEQRAIASVLSSLDDKIDLLHRQNKTLEAMAETLFRQWFVEEADEGWEEGKIPDEFDFTMGLSPPGESYNEKGIGIPMYQGNADFKFRFPKRRVFTTDPKRFAEQFDTLISVRAPVGAQNMADERCCIGRGVATFRYKRNNDYYTYTYFKMKSLMKEIEQFNQTGTVFGSISKADFEDLAIVIPSVEFVDAFQKDIKPIDDKVIANCMQIRTLEKLRDTLLPKLMSGEWIGSYTLTEANAGSDALSGKAYAVLSDDGKYWTLNGEKSFITNAGFADLYIVFAKIDREHFSAFIIEKGYEGFSLGAEEKKMGIKGSSTRTISMNNLKIPVENLLGEKGKGHVIAFNILNIGRFKLGAGCVGASKSPNTSIRNSAASLRASFSTTRGQPKRGMPAASPKWAIACFCASVGAPWAPEATWRCHRSKAASPMAASPMGRPRSSSALPPSVALP